ncbi:MAG: DUF2721 domain-containing protein [Novosphingobium sp.]
MIAHTIQLALAPVFLLVAMGNILNILSARLGRIVDRGRHLQALHGETSGPAHDMVVTEIRAIDRRIALITRAISLLVLSGLLVGTTVAVLFLEEMADFKLERLAAGFFLLAIALIMAGLTLLLSEIRIAATSLRVPLDYLELHRDL